MFTSWPSDCHVARLCREVCSWPSSTNVSTRNGSPQCCCQLCRHRFHKVTAASAGAQLSTSFNLPFREPHRIISVQQDTQVDRCRLTVQSRPLKLQRHFIGGRALASEHGVTSSCRTHAILSNIGCALFLRNLSAHNHLESSQCQRQT